MATFSSVHDVADHTGIPGVGGSLTVQDEGTPLATGATTIDFVGAGVTATGAGATKTITIPGGGGITSGTSFPGSPSDNDLFFRTDLPCGLYRYESTGTMWLCASQHDLPLTVRAVVGTGGLAATTASLSNGSTLMSLGDMYIDDFIGATFVNTTNNGTSYWDITLAKLTAANAATTVGTISTISNAPDTWVEEKDDVDEIVSGSAHLAFRLGATKVSAAGNLIFDARILWRHVVDV